MTEDSTQPLRIGNIRALNGCAGRLFGAATLHNHKNSGTGTTLKTGLCVTVNSFSTALKKLFITGTNIPSSSLSLPLHICNVFIQIQNVYCFSLLATSNNSL